MAINRRTASSGGAPPGYENAAPAAIETAPPPVAVTGLQNRQGRVLVNPAAVVAATETGSAPIAHPAAVAGLQNRQGRVLVNPAVVAATETGSAPIAHPVAEAEQQNQQIG